MVYSKTVFSCLHLEEVVTLALFMRINSNFCGVIYIATGAKYIQEACVSATSLKANSPQLSVTIFADTYVQCPNFTNRVFLDKPSFSFLDKVKNIYYSPYKYTLYLDSDTYICSDISELFMLLDKFDIAVAHAPGRIASGSNYNIKGIPDSFPEMNAGVILFKKSNKLKKFFNIWLNLYLEDIRLHKEVGDTRHNVHDQPSFRCALYNSSLRIATLPPEYNCRFVFPCYVCRNVKILHGRHPNLLSIAEQINSTVKKRVFIPGSGIITI